MRLCRRFILAALVVSSVLLPSWLYALGEFDGFWVGTENISVAGEHESATVPTVIYQQNDSELYFWDDYFGAVRLIKSGNQWVLPAPLEAELWGYDIVITSVSFTFRSQSSLSGTINASVTGYNVTARATISATKQTCPVLSNGQTLSNQSGREDSFKCYQIELPANARDLQVETWGGSGDCDLGVIYGRPDFDFDISEGDYNDELVVFPNPQSGKWYIGLYGFESYSGVNLQASFTEIVEVVAQFAVDTWFGPAPLQINFSDQSSGNLTSWFWNFGDGSNAYSQNPSHTYAAAGIYTVSLTVSGPDGSDTKTVSNLVRVYSADTRSDVEDFVSRFYSLCLSRDPDPSGLDYWVSSLLDGTRTGADVARGFVFSQEFVNLNVSDDQYLRILYRAFFDREPDTDGYTYWLDKLQAGVGRDEVLNGFIFATEFANLCNNYSITPSRDLTPVEAFVTRFYQQCLERIPEPLGLDYWVSSLLDGSRTGADVAYGFVFSQEFLNRNVDDQTFLTILYRAFFDREPDSGGYNDWYTQLQQGTSRETVLNGFLGAQEFFNLCDQYGITPQ